MVNIPIPSCKNKLLADLIKSVAFHLKKKRFVAFSWTEASTGPGGFMVCVCVL